ncbi:MAG: sensor histidine kinase [Bacteroidia bacterium]|nr:sensor histidine kinase [Bacteroidia bacterium]
MKLGNNEEAIGQFLAVLNIARRNKLYEQTKFLLNHLALTYTYLPNYDKALEYHFQSLVMREKDGNKSDLSIAYNNIGFVYYKLKDYERALEYYKLSLASKREANDKYEMDQTMINIGLCYNELGSYDEAIRYLNEAFSFCGEECSANTLIQGHYGLGKANLGLGKVALSESEFHTSLDIATNSKDNFFMVENLIQLNRLAFDRGEYDKSLDYLQQADAILDNLEFKELQFIVFLAFAKTYNKVDDYKQASHYQSKYISLKDSVYSEALIKNLHACKQTMKKGKTKKSLRNAKRHWRGSAGSISRSPLSPSLPVCLCLCSTAATKPKKRVNLALSDAKSTIEDQNKELTRLNQGLNKIVDERTVELKVANEALTRVNDELDNFIYKTSHDIRGPLASLKGMCNVALMDVKDPLALDYFRKLDATAERLNTILTRLLIINQINNSTTNLEAIDFGAIVDDVIIWKGRRACLRGSSFTSRSRIRLCSNPTRN